MDLKLAYDSDADLVYRQRLEESLAAYSPALLAQDRWNRAFVLSQPQFVNEHVFVKSAIAFGGLPTLPKLELKVYWAGCYRIRAKILIRLSSGEYCQWPGFASAGRISLSDFR